MSTITFSDLNQRSSAKQIEPLSAPPRRKRIVHTPEVSLCERISRVFCCSVPRDEPESPPPSPSVIRESNPLEFRYTGEGVYGHQVLYAKRFIPITGSFEPAALYTQLNAMDYDLIKKVIEKDSSDKQNVILKELNIMWEEDVFIDPEKLAVRVEEFPDSLLEQIKAVASLALVLKRAIQGSRDTPYNLIVKVLYTDFCKYSAGVFKHHTGRPFQNLDEQVICIRWGILHAYEPSFKPESITQDLKENKKNFIDPESPKKVIDSCSDSSVTGGSSSSDDDSYVT